ncbi:histone acetyltransferase mst2 [Lentinula edodes]|uniref:Histone acetyltransferase mst2 n=1 Tax=Lentinula edodes TaxID=5353 RepID=A0A1Q3EKT0_LENED|nr:histone acetyltransferase mst2 [Lentinula edodes]
MPVGQVRSDTVMQYGHLGMGERRDSGMDNGSTTFQSHVPSLNQALGHGHIGSAFSRAHNQDYRVSPSPPVHPQQNGQPAQQPKESYLAYGVPSASQVKRKHIADGVLNQTNNKRRRDVEDAADSFDDPGGQGAKHWTDEEKSKLFKWLMGPESKKTYQALKGCYERNFNLFKQIHIFENFLGATGSLELSPDLSETDSLREYERRLASARKAGCDVGNITARTIDQWHRNGWYSLFYSRWNGDPATTRSTNSRLIHGCEHHVIYESFRDAARAAYFSPYKCPYVYTTFTYIPNIVFFRSFFWVSSEQPPRIVKFVIQFILPSQFVTQSCAASDRFPIIFFHINTFFHKYSIIYAHVFLIFIRFQSSLFNSFFFLLLSVFF